ncbi:MAG: ABC transporter permease [Clostridiales bacterium]|nr:ABC transporter permease [Clostridiales bacterium]
MNEQQFEKYNNIPAEKFAFASQGDKLHDKKLDTKAVSYARDSFRRFCKNKASVVAAIILGIIILFAIIVPMATGVDVDRVGVTEGFLPPKLFEAGTGFWDGTTSFSRIIYDVANETPAGKEARAVLNLVVDEEPTLINQASPFATGGYIMFENQSSNSSTTNVLSSDTFRVAVNGNYTVSIKFGNIDEVYGGKLGEYRIYLSGGEEHILLQDWSSDYSNVNINISSLLEQADVAVITNARIVFELKSAQGKYSYLLIASCVFSADESVGEDILERLETVGFTNPSHMALLAGEGGSVFPDGYWSCTGRKGVYACEVYYCDFDYDPYEVVYGETEVIYTKTDLDRFVANGWCEYSFDRSTAEITFTKLSENCPFDEILSVNTNYITGQLLDVTVLSHRYVALGYTSMPKYLFGTDPNGVDLFTRMFKGLRTSLLLGVATFAFCFMFGLVWGSISGYFGGTIDLAMERFCDILGGVPWIVVMTLCILHLGNNFGTFVLALCMTGWMGIAGLTRTQFYRFKHMEHVLAARTLGASDWRLIFKHILPNSLGTIITAAVFGIVNVIYSEATLAYLNLGLQGTTSFGVILSDHQQYLQSNSYLITIPSIVMTLLMISFNLFGNGLRDAINPALKGSEG